jgi:hypothetical protein
LFPSQSLEWETARGQGSGAEKIFDPCFHFLMIEAFPVPLHLLDLRERQTE